MSDRPRQRTYTILFCCDDEDSIKKGIKSLIKQKRALGTSSAGFCTRLRQTPNIRNLHNNWEFREDKERKRRRKDQGRPQKEPAARAFRSSGEVIYLLTLHYLGSQLSQERHHASHHPQYAFVQYQGGTERVSDFSLLKLEKCTAAARQLADQSPTN